MVEKENKKWGVENPFTVPDGYFDDDEIIAQKITNSSRAIRGNPSKKISIIAPWIGMAAAFLIIALAYRQLPGKIFPKKFDSMQVDTDVLLESSPWYLSGDYELIEIITEKDDINIIPDSIIFEGLNVDDLVMLTLFQ